MRTRLLLVIFLEIEVDAEISDERMCRLFAKQKRSDSIHTQDHPYHCHEKTENIDRAVHGLYDPVFNEDDGPFGDDGNGEDC